MNAYIDLHCHYLPSFDDGCRSLEETVALLRGLRELGFQRVVATPHLRPDLFGTHPEPMRRCYGETCLALREVSGLPELGLGAEHFLDDQVRAWIMEGYGLPFRDKDEAELLTHSAQVRRRGGALLIEVQDLAPFSVYFRQFMELSAAGYRVVLAHPERYPLLWERPDRAQELVDNGVILQLDVCTVIGKYGKKTQACGERLLDLEVFDLAASDCHRPADLELLQRGLEVLEGHVGKAELAFLLREAPARLLAGQKP